MERFREKHVFAGVVEEYKHSNRDGYLKWHFACTKCKQRMRFNSGECALDCPTCRTEYEVKLDGRVMRLDMVPLEDDDYSDYPVAREQETLSPPAKQMQGGFFSRVSSAFKEANEDAHGKRLREGLLSTGQAIKQLDERMLQLAFKKYLEKKTHLENQMINWSQEGKIKMGRTLQDEARSKFDFNQAESYALWLAGAWIESGFRRSDDAVFVHESLETLANELQRNLLD